MFTRGHFVAIAKLLNRYKNKLGDKVHLALSEEFATLFAESNPRFQREKFLSVCGAEEE